MKTQNHLLRCFEKSFHEFSQKFLSTLPRQGLTHRLTKYRLEGQGDSLTEIDGVGFERQALRGAFMTVSGGNAAFEVEISQPSVFTGAHLSSLYQGFCDGWAVFRFLPRESGVIVVDPSSQRPTLPLFLNLAFSPPTEAGHSNSRIAGSS